MRPEILAPAGDTEALRAALLAGAEAVYFGLDEGFNARARADNFCLDRLPLVVEQIHRAGARAYLTLNTLIFESELEALERVLRRVAFSGVDALIVQDPAVALLARSLAPSLELHASTQMTISSPEGARFAQLLGITRVVVPRELSVDEIALMAEGTELELEAFIMGALCVSWSGQCLSSEAWGGRSANRGRCAQACRLPYDLVVDDEVRPLGPVAYLLSPQDLAGFRAVQRLAEIGVKTLKIEGRQKSAQYVYTAVTSLRDWLDRADETSLRRQLRDLTVSYSRGFTDGFLAGSDHQTLVEGLRPRHRGLPLGQVESVEGNVVTVVAEESSGKKADGTVSCPLPALGGDPDSSSGPALEVSDPRPGMGVVFDQGDEQQHEQGGPLFGVERRQGKLLLRFGKPGPDLTLVRPGARVLLTSDPEVTKRVQQALRSPDPDGRWPLQLKVSGRQEGRMRLSGEWAGGSAEVESDQKLSAARKRSLERAVLEEKLGALGGTPFRLAGLDQNQLDDDLFLPLSQLKSLRRDLVALLEEQMVTPHPVSAEPALPRLRAELRQRVRPAGGPGCLVPLCRNEEQLEAALKAGCREVELDWMELVRLNAAVEQARQAGARVCLATVRVQKPGEEVYDRRIQKLDPDAVLVRHWGGVMHFSGRLGPESQAGGGRPIVHGDFSLNVTNSLTAHYLLDLGLETVTAAHDLDRVQLLRLLDQVAPGRLAVTIHHHIPTFHTEHCVYSALLSQGRDYRSCGRPCEKHQVSLRDRIGKVHPVIVDVGCRNTVFNAAAQSAASLVPELLQRKVSRLRVEFVRESGAEVTRVLETYRALMQGSIKPEQAVKTLGTHEQFGVTAGTMRVIN